MSIKTQLIIEKVQHGLPWQLNQAPCKGLVQELWSDRIFPRETKHICPLTPGRGSMTNQYPDITKAQHRGPMSFNGNASRNMGEGLLQKQK